MKNDKENFVPNNSDNNLISDYFNFRQGVFDYFGYVEDWKAIPLEDSRGYFWYLTGVEADDSVWFAESEEELDPENRDGMYKDDIYSQRFLPKWVYRSEKYTMVCSDPHTDGNKFLRVFDNSKEVKPLESYEREPE